MNIQTISLDVTKSLAAVPVVRIRKGDVNGTTLKANIYDNGEPLDLTGYAVKFRMRIPRGAGVYEVAGTASGNTATFTVNEALAAIETGVACVAYVRVEQGDTFACSTGNVHVVVMESASEQ